MRSDLLARWLAAGILLAIVGPGTASAEARPCKRPAMTVLLANDRVALLERPIRGGEETRYYGCRKRDGRVRILSETWGSPESNGPSGFVLVGNWLGWRESTCSRYYGCATQDVNAVNMTNGNGLSLETHGLVDWQLTRRGRLVVMDGGPGVPGDEAVQRRIRVSSPAAGERVLTRGDDLDAGSLAVSDSRVYWTRQGRPETAPLP